MANVDLEVIARQLDHLVDGVADRKDDMAVLMERIGGDDSRLARSPSAADKRVDDLEV